jgi:hypothetical protein
VVRGARRRGRGGRRSGCGHAFDAVVLLAGWARGGYVRGWRRVGVLIGSTGMFALVVRQLGWPCSRRGCSVGRFRQHGIRPGLGADGGLAVVVRGARRRGRGGRRSGLRTRVRRGCFAGGLFPRGEPPVGTGVCGGGVCWWEVRGGHAFGVVVCRRAAPARGEPAGETGTSDGGLCWWEVRGGHAFGVAVCWWDVRGTASCRSHPCRAGLPRCGRGPLVGRSGWRRARGELGGCGMSACGRLTSQPQHAPRRGSEVCWV